MKIWKKCKKHFFGVFSLYVPYYRGDFKKKLLSNTFAPPNFPESMVFLYH